MFDDDLIIPVALALAFLSTLLFCLIVLTPAQGYVQQNRDYSSTATDTQFERISSGSRISVFRELRTDVLYMSYHAGGKGGLTVMLDTDGSPLTYSRWKELS